MFLALASSLAYGIALISSGAASVEATPAVMIHDTGYSSSISVPRQGDDPFCELFNVINENDCVWHYNNTLVFARCDNPPHPSCPAPWES